jgi:hypothetical protein
MTKCFLYLAPIALIGLMATDAPAVPAVWSGSMARNIAVATADAKDAPLVLVRGGGRGGGGGYRGGAAGRGSWAGAGAGVNRGNFSGTNVNRGNLNSANINRGASTAPTSTETSTSTGTSMSAAAATTGAAITGRAGVALPLVP